MKKVEVEAEAKGKDRGWRFAGVYGTNQIDQMDKTDQIDQTNQIEVRDGDR